VAGGMGDFGVELEGMCLAAGAAGAAGNGRPVRIPGSLPQGARLHYIVIAAAGTAPGEPLRFHNGRLDDLKSRFRLSARVPLPDLPGFFPAGAEGGMAFEGRDIFHLDSALRGQPLFSHLEALRLLVQKAAGRRLAFPEFLSEINRIPIPSEWRNEIVNGLFDNAHAPAAPAAPKSGMNRDLERILDMFREGDGGGTALNPNLGRFLDEVGRDSTGFILKDGAAQALHQDLTRTLETLRAGLLRHGALASALGLLASLQRLARLAKGRDRQTAHLWTGIPSDVAGELAADGETFLASLALALALADAFAHPPEFLRRAADLAARLGCPLLVQLPGESIPAEGPEAEAVAALASGAPEHTYFFAGGVAARVDGEAHVFRPAVLAFLEGLVAAREPVAGFRHRAMALEDQDVVAEKGQGRAADRLLDGAGVQALSERRVNRLNGVRNRAEAVFPLLRPWKDA